jgi:hypothetical protein
MQLYNFNRDGAAADSSGSISTMAVTLTSSRTRSSEALYGASGSIELTTIVISDMTEEDQKAANLTREK